MTDSTARDPLADFDAEIYAFLEAQGFDVAAVRLAVPKRPEHGERAANIFAAARERGRPPMELAAELAGAFDPARYSFIGAVEAVAGFVNFRLAFERFVPHVVQSVNAAGTTFGRRDGPSLRAIVEHSSVNPNKEWHIGHVRNAVLGDVVARVLRLAGHEVEVQNYIDDTGLQAATSVFALLNFPEPREEGEKYDHYVGRLYVKISREFAEEARLKEQLAGPGDDRDPVRASAAARLQNIQRRLQPGTVRVMHEIEAGEHVEIINDVLQAQLETPFRLGISYDLLNWESHLVRSHLFGTAMDLLERSEHADRPEEGRYAGAFVIHTGGTTTEGEEKAEVLIRSNGIPTYVGKDIAYHMWKLRIVPDPLSYIVFLQQPDGSLLWSTSLEGEYRPAERPDRVINIIAVNQSQPQEAVKLGLQAAGFEEDAGKLFHLAYGLVKTREGMLSGRRGTAAAADDVIQAAVDAALERMKEKMAGEDGVPADDRELRATAEALGVGAVRYFMVQYNPLREIVFDLNDVVSFDGNTGLYLQYALARLHSILRKAEEAGVPTDAIDAADASLLQHEQERRLAFHLAQWPDTVATAARTLAVNLVAEWAYDLATIFSQFYRDCRVLNAEPELRDARLLLVRTVRDALTHACAVLGVPAIERL